MWPEFFHTIIQCITSKEVHNAQILISNPEWWYYISDKTSEQTTYQIAFIYFVGFSYGYPMDNHGYVWWSLIMPIHNFDINAYIHNSIMGHPQFDLRIYDPRQLWISIILLYIHTHNSVMDINYFPRIPFWISIIESWISIYMILNCEYPLLNCKSISVIEL